jgi:3-deoxy-manno-octulosonate cytidylyltransferase (CMP-KDO synthetase)
MSTAIVIPARYASKRFPGKPLAKIAGVEMLKRVWKIASLVKKKYPDTYAVVATDDNRIKSFCEQNNINYVMTAESCRTGTERTAEALQKIDFEPDFVINLQGDNPLCPPWFIESMIECYYENPTIDMITPYVKLKWSDLDALRKQKEKSPFSGTSVIVNKNGDAIWFSKNIIPAIRKEESVREKNEFSPVKRHIGLYGYSPKMLSIMPSIKATEYEECEGLEQLPILEAGYKIKMQEVDYKDRTGMSGVDTPEDAEKATKLFEEFGEFDKYYK